MVNGPEHTKSQELFKQLLSEHGYECKTDFEYKTGVIDEKGNRKATKYYFDVYGEKSNINGWFYISKHIALPIWDVFDVIIIEIDGKVGHSSKRSYENRQVRKEFCKEKNFRFFEFPTKWIVGKKKLDIQVFLEEIKPI